MSGVGQFEFDLDFYTNTSLSRISTEDDFKNIGETVFAGVKPAQSMSGIQFYFDSCEGKVFFNLFRSEPPQYFVLSIIFLQLPMSLIDQLH